MTGTVRVEARGLVAVVTISQPERRNALSQAMWAAIPSAMTEAARSRAVVLTGDGGHFAAGADISEFEETYRDRSSATEALDRLAAAMSAVADCPVPVVAAIRGACVGGGCGLALCCDLRFAAPDAVFGITPAKLGLAYTLADTKRLVDAVGPSAARDILLSGRILKADEAFRMGLVDRVRDDPLKTAVSYADGLAANAKGSLRTAKAMIARIVEGQTVDDDATRAAYLDLVDGPEFREGYAAFLEKRKPDFS